MINTNGLSPLMQAAVGGESKTIAGQYITHEGSGKFTYSPGEGMEPIPVQDPELIIEWTEDGLVVDNDYTVEEDEGGLVIKGVASGGEEAPGTPAESGGQIPGGVGGGPMEMHSPNKIYEDGKRRKNYTY